MREVAKLSVRLLIFALVAGLLLALTNEVTKGPIAQRQQEIQNQARAQVLPDAQEFVQMEIKNPEQYPDVAAVYEAKNGDATVGYALSLIHISSGKFLQVGKPGRFDGLRISFAQRTGDGVVGIAFGHSSDFQKPGL